MKFLLLLGVVQLVVLSYSTADVTIENLGIYEIISAAGPNETQVLTARVPDEKLGEQPAVFTRSYIGLNTQKWRFFNPSNQPFYMIYPTHNEKLVLDVDSKNMTYFSRVFDAGSRRQWVIHEMDEGTVQIINHKFSTCLRNRGPFEQVDMTECRNFPETRWILKKL